MSIRDLQIRLTEVGVIRLGEQRLSKAGKLHPAKLDTFRLTSPSKKVIIRAAELWGGEVRDWPEGPGGPQFQVTTAVDALQVFVLPQRIDPNLELWGKDCRLRLCDGVVEKLRNVPCLCEADARERYARAKTPWPENGRFARDPRADCKPTTRLSVMLADLSDGQWKVEAHGWNAAAELPAKATVYLAVARKAVPAVLRMRVRRDKVLRIRNGIEQVESREYVVPELDFGDLFTARMALTGGLNEAVRAALDGRRQQPALEPAPATQVDPGLVAGVWREVEAADSRDQLLRVWAGAQANGATADPELRAFFERRGAELERGKPTTGTDVETVSAPDEPVDAEIVDSAEDLDAAWSAILREAATRGWNMVEVEARYRDRMGHDPSDDVATVARMEQFLVAVKAGEVR